MDAPLSTLPAEAYRLGVAYRGALRGLERAEAPAGVAPRAHLDRLAGEANAATTALNRLLYRWLSAQADATVAGLAGHAPRVADAALLARVPEPHNRAYLVLRAYCEDGGVLPWPAWLAARSAPPDCS